MTDTLFEVIYQCKNCAKRFSTGHSFSSLEVSVEDLLKSADSKVTLHHCDGEITGLAKPVGAKKAGTREVKRVPGVLSDDNFVPV